MEQLFSFFFFFFSNESRMHLYRGLLMVGFEVESVRDCDTCMNVHVNC